MRTLKLCSSQTDEKPPKSAYFYKLVRHTSGIEFYRTPYSLTDLVVITAFKVLNLTVITVKPIF